MENLGWGGTNYSGSKIGPKWKPGFTKAIKYRVPSIATSAITIYKGSEFKEWNGFALVTSLKDKSLRAIDFSNPSNVKENVVFNCLLYTSPSPRDATLSRMPSSA